MQIDEILKAIDDQIEQLQQARALLATDTNGEASPKGRGRPKRAAALPTTAAKPVTRRLSEEGKARIAAAQKARWAAVKKAAKTTSTKKTAPAKKTARKSSAAKKSATAETTAQGES